MNYHSKPKTAEKKLDRYAIGWWNPERAWVEVDICPFCSGPHTHTPDGKGQEDHDFGAQQSECRRGRYRIINGAHMLRLEEERNG